MFPRVRLFILLLLAALAPHLSAAVETIVFIRHGEKPKDDHGQLTFQGLNRALALPRVLISKYGEANFIFAPCTLKLIHDGIPYSYVRPLITIEPTAIRLGLPIEAKFAYDDIDGLQKALLSSPYQSSLIFVAWEHHQLEKLLKNILASNGEDPAAIPEWPKDDFDSIYVVKITTDGDKHTITVRHDHEGLNGQSMKEPDPR